MADTADLRRPSGLLKGSTSSYDQNPLIAISCRFKSGLGHHLHRNSTSGTQCRKTHRPTAPRGALKGVIGRPYFYRSDKYGSINWNTLYRYWYWGNHTLYNNSNCFIYRILLKIWYLTFYKNYIIILIYWGKVPSYMPLSYNGSTRSS